MPSPSILEAGTVETHVRDGIGTVEFAHPKSNSMPGSLLSQLAEAVRVAGDDSAVRVIVIRSGGTGAFCAGASFDEFRAIRNEDEGRHFFSGFAKVILAMIRAPKFVIVRVQGRTAGGGVGLIAAADYAVGVTEAGVKLSEIAVGIGPFVVGPVIEKKIGNAAFAALAVDGDWRSAEWAERHGLYAELTGNAIKLDERVTALARKFSGYNPEAVRRLKEVLWSGSEEWPTLLSSRAAISGHLVLSEYTRTAIK